jgi:DnaJ-class molecular chaperone
MTQDMAPGDQAPEGTPGTGENTCPVCGGSGRSGDTACANCEGTGLIVEGIGGA